jgi:ribosomal protein L37E
MKDKLKTPQCNKCGEFMDKVIAYTCSKCGQKTKRGI